MLRKGHCGYSRVGVSKRGKQGPDHAVLYTRCSYFLSKQGKTLLVLSSGEISNLYFKIIILAVVCLTNPGMADSKNGNCGNSPGFE